MTVNRNKEQYKETNTERDIMNLNILINGMIKKTDGNAELMKQYIDSGKKKTFRSFFHIGDKT